MTFCLEHEDDRNLGVVLFIVATCNVLVESLVFSPIELCFGQNMHGLLKVVKDPWIDNDCVSLITFHIVKPYSPCCVMGSMSTQCQHNG